VVNDLADNGFSYEWEYSEAHASTISAIRKEFISSLWIDMKEKASLGYQKKARTKQSLLRAGDPVLVYRGRTKDRCSLVLGHVYSDVPPGKRRVQVTFPSGKTEELNIQSVASLPSIRLGGENTDTNAAIPGRILYVRIPTSSGDKCWYRGKILSIKEDAPWIVQVVWIERQDEINTSPPDPLQPAIQEQLDLSMEEFHWSK
jgi:hypothetical protein